MPAETGPPETGAVGQARNEGDGRREYLAALLVRARTGDREATGELVRALTPLLWNVARAQGLDRDTAEDAVQNTWLQLLRGNADIRSPYALTGWLVTVARREAARLARQARVRSADPDTLPDLAADAPSPEQLVTQVEADRRLWSHLQQLPPRCRELLRIVAFVDRPDYNLVSQALGMPKGGIGPTRGRCLGKLRLLLESDPGWSRS